MLTQPLGKLGSLDAPRRQIEHDALVIADRRIDLGAVQNEERLHGGMADALVAIEESVALNQGKAQRGRLLHQRGYKSTPPKLALGAGSTSAEGRDLVVVDEGWSGLPEHWCCAFRQAWAAYVASTIPVGAVVVDPHNVIAAEARNRIFAVDAPPRGQLAGSWLAHAELNAIAQIDTERSRTEEGWAVYSTFEPCPLCAGAITVAFRGRITVGYACRDPISSGLGVLTDTNIGRRRQWQVQKLRGPFAVFAELLLAVYTVEARPASLTAARYREEPWRSLVETTGPVLARGRDRGEAVEQVVATIWPAIAHIDLASDAL